MTTHATQQHPELEELAAFVDGRLSGIRRIRITEHLDRCPDCFELFAETVRFQGEDEAAGETGARVLRSGRFGPLGRFGGRNLAWLGAAAAALVAVAIALPLLRTEPGRPVLPGPDPVEPLLASADLLDTFSTEAPDAVAAAVWTDWPEPLGFAGGLDRDRLAFRAGVRLVDLRAAGRAEDRIRATAALDHLEELAGVAAGETRVRTLDLAVEKAREAVTDEDSELLDAAVSELEGQLEALLDPFSLAFGKWAEAGRLAAATGEPSLFRSARFREMLGEIRETLSEREAPPAVDRQLGEIQSLTVPPGDDPAAPPPDLGPDLGEDELDRLEAAFETLVVIG